MDLCAALIGTQRGGIPRLYAAASLKHGRTDGHGTRRGVYSAALCRGLIEASTPSASARSPSMSIPRLYAAASLKLSAELDNPVIVATVFRGSMPRPH